jgi:hypothetical protein
MSTLQTASPERLPGSSNERADHNTPSARGRCYYFILLVSALWLTTGYAQLHAATHLSLTGVRGFPGGTVQVPLILRGESNLPPGVVAMQADVLFDARGLLSTAPIKATGLPGHIIAASTPVNGTRRLLIYSMTNAPITAGTVAGLPFVVSTSTRASFFSLSLSNVILVDAAASPVASTNNSGYITINPVFPRPDGDVDVFLNAAPGQTYIIQATTNFSQWVNILTNTATDNIIIFTDPDAHAFPYRFYRTVLFDATSGERIGSITSLPNGSISLSLEGLQGQSYVLQTSTNLSQWVTLGSFFATNGIGTFIDTNSASFPSRFYRFKLNE